MVADLARNWWLLAIRGVAGIVFGIGAFVWPGITLAALVLLFGAYVMVDGVFAVAAGIGMRRSMDRWWLVVLEGVAGIVLGVLTFASPGITALILISFIAAWSIITGVLEIAMAVRMRKLIEHEWLLIASGIVESSNRLRTQDIGRVAFTCQSSIVIVRGQSDSFIRRQPW